MLRSHYFHVSAYVAKEFVLSFLVAFLFFFFIFFINQMLLLAEEILTKRIPLRDVTLLIIYSLPSIVALSFPFGSLVGALMAIGRFSADNEIIAFQASGVHLRRVFVPILFLGALFSVFSFVMNDYFLPLGTINFGRLYRELFYANPELELESYGVERYQDSILVTGQVTENRIDDLVILDKTDEGDERVIVSAEARIERSDMQEGVISIRLDDVFTHSRIPGVPRDYEYSEAGSMIYNILLNEISFTLRNPGPREMSSRDVYEEVVTRRVELNRRVAARRREVAERTLALANTYLAAAQDVSRGAEVPEAVLPDLVSEAQAIAERAAAPIQDRTLQLWEIEFHKKFSIPFACLTFVIFAFPVGLFTKRSGRAVGFGIGLLVSVLYWGMLIGGQTLGMQSTTLSPLMSMWLPNIVFLGLGVGAFFFRFR